MGGVAEHERAEAGGAVGGMVLRNEPADREAAEDNLGRAHVVDQPGKVGRVIGDRMGRLAEVGQAVPSLVVAKQGEVGGEIRRDLVPDPEVGPERVDEDEERPVRPGAVLVVERHACDLDEGHGVQPFLRSVRRLL